MKYWRPLGLSIAVLAALLTVYLGFTLSLSADPLERSFGLILALPSALVAVLGVQMARKRVWAAWLIRLVLIGTMAVGFTTGLFDFRLFSLPFTILGIAWIILSFA